MSLKRLQNSIIMKNSEGNYIYPRQVEYGMVCDYIRPAIIT